MPSPPNTHRYPFIGGDTLSAPWLNTVFELSAGSTPPAGRAGGAGQFKQWMDTSTNPPTLRIATAPRAAAGAYNAAEWASLGTLDINARSFAYQGSWTGDLHLANNGNLYANDLFLAGNYIGFMGGSGLSNGKPYFYADVHSIYTGLGTSYAGFSIQDATGHYCFVFDSNAEMFINSIPFVTSDAAAPGFTKIFDHAGNTAILLGDDGSTHIRNDIIYFASKGIGTTQFAYMNSGGVHIPSPSGLYTYSIIISGSFLGFNGSTGVNTGQSFIYMDNSTIYMQIPPGNANFVLRDTNANPVARITSFGLYLSNEVSMMSSNSADGFNYFYDHSSNAALLMGATTNLYRNTSHQFQTRGGAGNMMTLDSGGNMVVTGTIRTNASGNAVNAPNGDVVCQNIVMANDTVSRGVFRLRPSGESGARGARVECWAGDWNSIQFGMTTGHLSVSPDGGTSGFIFNSDSSYSDVRLKDNIRDTDVDALEILRQTPVRAFEWNAKGRELMPWANPVECGLVAQELKETIPVATGTAPFADEPMYINDQNLTPYLIRAIQQIADRLDAGGL